MQSFDHPLRVFTQDSGDFRSLRNTNVLVYFPHGFGDWVQFSYILPLLSRSNRYWFARFGDDNTSVLDGCEYAKPAYMGINSTHCGDGEHYGNRHFGLEYDRIDGTEQHVKLPASILNLCREEEIEALLWIGFGEVWGRAEAPYHTKARNQITKLASPKALERASLDRPLSSALSFDVPAPMRSWVESRLAAHTGWGPRRLCLISRNGYTAVGKNWGHMFREDMPDGGKMEGQECRDFMRLMLRKGPQWVFVVIEDRLFEGEHTVRDAQYNCFSYAELFGEPANSTVPFGWVMKALVNCADLSIGVPTGPYHLSMAKPGLPTIGLWIEHLPSWYDEPKEESIHLVSRNVRDRGFYARPGSFFEKGALKFNHVEVGTRILTAEQVLSAAEFLGVF